MMSTRRLISLTVAFAMIVPSLASAAEAGVATWLSPQQGETLAAPSVEVSVGYNTQTTTRVTRLELWVDGRFYSRKDLIRPETRGVCSFSWDTTRYSDGPHALEVKVYAYDTLLSSVSSTGTVGSTAFDMDPPVVVFSGIKNGDVIKGTADIKMEAHDNSGQPPLVSLLVDDSLKLVKNRPPYAYALDTTTYSDGKHELETYAYDGAGNKSNPAVVNVSFRNKVELPVVTALSVKPSRSTAASEDDGTGVVEPAKVASVPTSEMRSTASPALRSAEVPDVEAIMGRPVAPAVSASRTAPAKVAKPVTSAPAHTYMQTAPVLATAPTLPAAKTAVKTPSVRATVGTPELKARAQQLAAMPIEVVAKPPAELASIPEIVDPSAKPSGITNLPKTRTESRVATASQWTSAVEPVKPVDSAVSSPTSVMIAKAPSMRGADLGMISSSNAGAQEVVPDPVRPSERPAVVSTKGFPTTTGETARLRSERQAARASVSKRVALAPPMPSVKHPKTDTTSYVNDITAKTRVKVNVKQLPAAKIEYQARLEKKIVPISGKVKLRDLIHSLGGVIFWDPSTHTVTAYVGDVQMVFEVGSHTAMVNGKEMHIDRAPHIVRGRTIINAEVYHQAMAFASHIKTASAN